MSGTTTIAIVLLAYLLWVGFAQYIRALNVRAGDPEDFRVGVAMLVTKVYARLFQRLRVTGRQHIPRGIDPGPLIVVSNHTAGIDPILIQAVCPFEVRWMMAEDMRAPAAEPLWKWLRIIFVDRMGERSDGAIRDAMRWVRDGKVLGVFPEGHIERPGEAVLPFLPGVTLIAARSRARILPVIVRGTPRVDPAFRSLIIRGRCRLEFLPIIEAAEAKAMGRDLAQKLRELYLEHTGWPANDEPPQLIDGDWVYSESARAVSRAPEARSFLFRA